LRRAALRKSLYLGIMNRLLFWLFLACVSSVTGQTFKVAFGSCSNQRFNLDIFDTIRQHQPNAIVLLGDNVYLDTHDKDTMCLKYDSLLLHPAFRRLQEQIPIWPIWDDHDFGWNDAGKTYPEKEITKVLFLDAFDEPASSCRWKRAGIYGSKLIQLEGMRVQFIMLDTRTFRDSLCIFNELPHPKSYFPYWPEYSPCADTTRTLLGQEQWAWLEKQLREPADFRVVCSSIQFGHSFNGYESWNNFPWEKNKLAQLIRSTQANGVIFISGDVHYGEISKDTLEIGYPLYDITSSGLSSTWHSPAPNTNRMGEAIMENNFGLITLHPNLQRIEIQLIDKSNVIREQLILDKQTLIVPTKE
jgi:alkaline phosphatase D